MSDNAQQLIDALLDGRATPDQIEALGEWIAADPANADRFTRQSLLHSHSRDLLCGQATDDTQQETAPHATDSAISNSKFSIFNGPFLAIAAALLLACGLAAYFFILNPEPSAPEPSTEPIATLIESTGGTLTTPGGFVGAGREYTAGDYTLSGGDAGRAQFVLNNRVTVDLQGDTHLRMHHPMSVALTRGIAAFNVPTEATGFTVHLPDRARIVDLGTAFRVVINDSGRSEVEVTAGAIEYYAPAEPNKPVRIERGEFAAIDPDGRIQRFPNVREAIHLGNLFDDDKSAALADALGTDAMAAEADEDDLGVYTVAQGADAVQEVAPDVWMDFRPLGWGFAGFGSVGNDAWTGDRGRQGEAVTGIRTTGAAAALGIGRHEQGIGMHADAVVVFDLGELRRAGHLGDLPLQLVVDRAGYNDDARGGDRAVHMIVAVSHADGSVIAHVNGERVELSKDNNDIWQIAKSPGHPGPIRSDGEHAAFDIALGASATHVAFVVTGGGDGIGKDHAVFSGARIEIEPPAPDTPTEQSPEEDSPGKDRAKD